jgi:UDP-N-acetylglucosamine 2-epimerase (non-hydrolysing)
MIYLIGGARPNFMKIAAITRALEKNKMVYEIIHTGQHYDYNMNDVFFNEFNLKKPYVHLGVGSGNHGEQTGNIMKKFEELCVKEPPDIVITVGDVNSTMAASLVASKLHIPCAHQEAGMRSFDKKMPEEINRIVSDHVSDLLFPISPKDETNLINEGISREKIFLVGDAMIDNLLYYTKDIEDSSEDSNKILVELHRPVNVDNFDNLKNILMALVRLTKTYNVLFPVHPRTRKMIEKFKLFDLIVDVEIVEPMGYFDFIKNVKQASCVITDSDGLQQETSILNIPCIAIRDTSNIEYTIKYGTTKLCDPIDFMVFDYVKDALYKKPKSNFPEFLKKLNDGNASERMVKIINGFCRS